jgi:hypothetical protein
VILNAKSIQVKSGTFVRSIEGIPAVFPAYIPKLSRLSRNGQSIGKTRKDAEKGSVILHQ